MLKTFQFLIYIFVLRDMYSFHKLFSKKITHLGLNLNGLQPLSLGMDVIALS